MASERVGENFFTPEFPDGAEGKDWPAVPQACSAIKATPVFNQGFHFRYRYLNREGRVMDDFLVNRPACEGL